MIQSPIEVIPGSQTIPVIASIPHGGTYIPEKFSRDLTIDSELLWSDWYTLELFDFLSKLNITIIKTSWSRFVADANRDPTKPVFAPFWEGIVASTDSQGISIYREEPSDIELKERMELAYHSYHSELHRIVSDTLKKFSKLLLVDLHSFGMPIPADIVLGDGNGKTADLAIVERVEGVISRAGLDCKRNKKFSGGWIVRQFAEDHRVNAIQLELNQRLYLNSQDVENAVPQPRRAEGKLKHLKDSLHNVFQEMITISK